MTNFHDLLVERHSIRRYTDQAINADDVRLILEAALLSPTSKSSRSWQFVVVEDPETIAKLKDCKPFGAKSLETAKLAIAVVADPTRSEAYIEDASIAAEMMQLQAADLGIGSCWVQVMGRYAADSTPSVEVVQEILGIPEEYPVLCIMTFGYSAETRKPVDTSKLLWERVHLHTWHQDQL